MHSKLAQSNYPRVTSSGTLRSTSAKELTKVRLYPRAQRPGAGASPSACRGRPRFRPPITFCLAPVPAATVRAANKAVFRNGRAHGCRAGIAEDAGIPSHRLPGVSPCAPVRRVTAASAPVVRMPRDATRWKRERATSMWVEAWRAAVLYLRALCTRARPSRCILDASARLSPLGNGACPMHPTAQGNVCK